MNISSGSKKSHQCNHEYVYHHDETKVVIVNVNNSVLYSCHRQKKRQEFHTPHVAHQKETFHPYFIRMNAAKFGSVGCRRKIQIIQMILK